MLLMMTLLNLLMNMRREGAENNEHNLTTRSLNVRRERLRGCEILRRYNTYVRVAVMLPLCSHHGKNPLFEKKKKLPPLPFSATHIQ
jgi:hypothetical protein